MRGLFWFLSLFALAIAVALGARMNDGYVLIVFSPWRVEISLNLFLIALLATLFIGYALIRTLQLTFGLPQRAREFRARRGREQAYRQLRDAMRLLFEGRLGQAMRVATAAHDTGEAPGLAALIASRAAQGLREPEKQRAWLEQACRDDSGNEVAALMLETEMLVELRDFETALLRLQRLQERHGRHIAAIRLELRARRGVGDWDEVLRLIRLLEKRDALTHQLAHKLRQEAHLGNIRERAGDAESLCQYLRDLPDTEQRPRLALAVAQNLHAIVAEGSAAAVIEDALEAGDDGEWHDDLIALYGLLGGSALTARIARAEAWLLQRPRDAMLLLTLGRLCQRQRLWGKAQSYLEASLSMQETAAAHLQLAHMFDELEKPELANRHFRLSVEPKRNR